MTDLEALLKAVDRRRDAMTPDTPDTELRTLHVLASVLVEAAHAQWKAVPKQAKTEESEPGAVPGVDIWCNACGDRLRHRHGAHADGARYITITPCDTCIEDADADGFNRGYKLATQDGAAETPTVPDEVLRARVAELEAELDEAVTWIFGSEDEIGLLDTTDGYYQWTLDPRARRLNPKLRASASAGTVHTQVSTTQE